ncbi:MAG: hypothetical protein CEO12_18 [Parcubacteria group bacterium Gr01-1014_46]|nr:MAG: hypothetical protein CEO12_18 [Parcubacteria group bacterium Gr01-1014_46]
MAEEASMTKEEMDIWELAVRILGPKGQIQVSNHLKEGKIVLAKCFLLGVLDRRFAEGQLEGIDPARDYQTVNLDPSIKERIRQQTGRL